MLLKLYKGFIRNIKHFDIVAISINPGFEFFDTQFLQKICDDLDIPLFIDDSHAKEIVFDIRKEKNPCSLCANLRRGIINSIAIKEGCNKIALGHNQDDVLETFLLNLLYTGNIGTFAPKSYMDRTKITLIRPLIYTPEKDIKRFIKKNNISVMPKVSRKIIFLLCLKFALWTVSLNVKI